MSDYRIIGIESSPYAVKVRAVMRYRRLPHVWVARMPQFFEETQAVRPLLMPVVQFPDGSYRTDSTTIVHALEAAHPNGRGVIPPDPGMGFICHLIEDMADEWLTKSLFHYRFSDAADRRFAATWVMDDAHPELDTDALSPIVDAFIARQVERMPLVGCTAENAPLLETFYTDILASLEPFVATDRFLFGSRPSLADFALFGQLRTLSCDPTPGAIMRETAPRTWNWIGRVDDLSGLDGAWHAAERTTPAVESLLALAGRIYLPYLAANTLALEEGTSEMSATLDGYAYRQPPFRYHGKCREMILTAYARLPADSRRRLDPLLKRTGCLEHLRD